MFLTRDQQIACDTVREKGFNPSNVITLTAHSRTHKGVVISVAAIKEDVRYNLRVLVKGLTGSLLGGDALETVIRSSSVNINECVIGEIKRTPMLLKE